jgi:hypothetical protein
MSTSKQAAAPAEAKPETAVVAEVSPRERIARTRSGQLEVAGAARAARRREVALHQLRTLCEDADELLGQAAEAARIGDAEAAVEPLTAVRCVAAAILRALRRPVPAAGAAAGRQDALGEDRVLAGLAVVEELDSQLRDARIGYRGGGWRAAQLATRLLRAVDELIRAAATGRARARTLREFSEPDVVGEPEVVVERRGR